jgi:Phenylacetic acid-responsive transcriptional repressor
VLAGIGLAFSYSPFQQYRLIRGVSKEWRQINRHALRRAIDAFEKEGILEMVRRADGEYDVVLTTKGTLFAQITCFDALVEHPRPERWDGVWRVVMYDVPEHSAQFRRELCVKLAKIGFFEYQRSVFVYPYPCLEQVRMLQDLYDAHRYVRYAEATHIDADKALRVFFGLPPNTGTA